MNRLLIFFITMLFLTSCSDPRNKSNSNPDGLKPKIENEKIDLPKYIDKIFFYEIDIPSWFKVIESNNPKIWGGTLPVINKIENAIMIKGYDKKEFKSFQDFKNKIVEKNIFGTPMQMNSAHISMGNKVLDEIPNIGPAYKQYLSWKGNLYDCQFVLAQTTTGYIWINFTATRETYDKNLGKFNEFINGLKIRK